MGGEGMERWGVGNGGEDWGMTRWEETHHLSYLWMEGGK